MKFFFFLFKKQLQCYQDIASNWLLLFDEISVRKGIEVDLKTMTFQGLQNFGENVEENAATLQNQADTML